MKFSFIFVFCIMATTKTAPASKLKFTKEQVEEYMKCAEDPIYFIETYCKIVSLDAGLVAFTLHDFQKEKVMLMLSERRVIIMEPRQQGKTVTADEPDSLRGPQFKAAWLDELAKWRQKRSRRVRPASCPPRWSRNSPRCSSRRSDEPFMRGSPLPDLS